MNKHKLFSKHNVFNIQPYVICKLFIHMLSEKSQILFTMNLFSGHTVVGCNINVITIVNKLSVMLRTRNYSRDAEKTSTIN